MKTTYSISIPTPCSEDWNSFIPEEKGRHCSTCKKVVIDFSNMSDRQILAFLQHKNTKTCGRFRADQMKKYESWMAPKINPGFSLLKAGLIGFVFALIAKESGAQSIKGEVTTTMANYPISHDASATTARALSTITGTVTSKEDDGPLPGVNVFIKGTDVGTVTDGDGKFSLSHDFKEGDVLIFSFIGFKTEEYKIKQLDRVIELPLTLELDVEIMGELLIEQPYQEKSSISKLWRKVKNVF